jgi:hypothetical protein
MKSYREYLSDLITKRNSDIKTEAFRRAVLAAAENGDRERILNLRKLHEYTGDDSFPEDDACLKIADAALTTLGSEELRKAVEVQNTLDEIINDWSADEQIAFVKVSKILHPERLKALNEKLAEHK